MPKRRVYIIAPGGTLARGGMGQMVVHLANRLAMDPSLEISTIDTYGPRVNEPRAKFAMPFHFMRAVVLLLAACIARRIDLAHVQMAAYGSVYRKSVMILICRAFRVPLILHIHGGDLDQFCADLPAVALRVLRWVLAGVSEVIVLGEYWRKFVVRELEVPAERVTILYNAVPRPALAPTKSVGAPCEILFLGMVWREKGMDELLEALSLPALSGGSWHLTIAGIGDIPRYQDQVRRLQLADRVSFVGWADDKTKRHLLERAEILVLPSHFECFSMAVIEAMAYGLAIVVTPVGAVPEAVTDGETGLLVPVGDSERLATAISRLIRDRALRLQLGARARARFCQSFDLDIFERRIRQIYHKHMIVG
jgi:glycosyltransferase involved in cell wall biosynthesis